MIGHQEAGWCVVIAKPSSEEIAASNIRRAGYREYLPRYRRILWPHGRDKACAQRMVPLIPGYVFVHDYRGFDPRHPVQGTNGLMRVGGELAILSDVDIDLIRRKELAGGFDEPRPSERRANRDDIHVGDAVSMDLHGNKVMAAIEALSSNGRAIIANALGIRMTVDQAALELVGA